MKRLNVEEAKKNNLYETIADTLEQMILEDTLKVGDRLPSEAMLAENFGVSRNIVRESLKILKERGLVELKNGEGARIVRPTVNSLQDMINRLTIMNGFSLEQIYEIRKALEVSACGYAAARATPEQIQRLHEAVALMEQHKSNKESWIQYDLLFHTYIAEASNNILFSEFLKSLSDALKMLFDRGYDTPGALEESLSMHKQIIATIESGDSRAAEEKMMEHLNRSSYDSSFRQPESLS